MGRAIAVFWVLFSVILLVDVWWRSTVRKEKIILLGAVLRSLCYCSLAVFILFAIVYVF